MKQTCVIVILAYVTWFQHKPRWKRLLNIKYPFLTLDFSKQNGASVKLSNGITSLQRHIYACNVFANESIGEMISHGRNAFPCTSCIQIGAQFRHFQVKAMFKQHVNLMIWTWILRLQTASRNEFPCKNKRLNPFLLFVYLDDYTTAHLFVSVEFALKTHVIRISFPTRISKIQSMPTFDTRWTAVQRIYLLTNQ